MRHLFAPWRHAWVVGDGLRRDEGECLFCRIWEHPEEDVENLVVLREELCLALLNRYPYNGGHLLLAPREHKRGLEELTPAARTALIELAARALVALGDLQHPDGCNIGLNQGRAGGAGVPEHVHLHVVPRWTGDTNFMTTVAAERVVSLDLAEAGRRLAAWFAAEQHHG